MVGLVTNYNYLSLINIQRCRSGTLGATADIDTEKGGFNSNNDKFIESKIKICFVNPVCFPTQITSKIQHKSDLNYLSLKVKMFSKH